MVIDTNIFIEHLRAKNKTATRLYQLVTSAEIFTSSITLYELYMGATDDTKAQDIKRLTEDLIILPFNSAVAEKAAEIYHDLKRTNKLIEFRDIFIAATCIVNQQPVATLNTKHFEHVKGLSIIS